MYLSIRRVIKQTSNYKGISLLPTTYKILSNIMSRLVPYAEEIIGDHQYGFRRNRSTTDHYSAFVKCLRKKWEYNEVVHQLSIDFKKADISVRREVLYNILIEFVFPMKPVWTGSGWLGIGTGGEHL